jgi:hypothetical protein
MGNHLWRVKPVPLNGFGVDFLILELLHVLCLVRVIGNASRNNIASIGTLNCGFGMWCASNMSFGIFLVDGATWLAAILNRLSRLSMTQCIPDLLAMLAPSRSNPLFHAF